MVGVRYRKFSESEAMHESAARGVGRPELPDDLRRQADI
jgi:hypothetical protein